MIRTAISLALLAIALASCLSVSPEKPETHAIHVPMKLVKRTPVLTVRVNDIEIDLQLDTGSGTTLTLYPEILEQLEIDPTGEVHESIGMEGVAMKNSVYVASRVELGGAIYRDMPVRQDDHTEKHRTDTIAYRGTYGRVGRGLFEDGKIIIDYQNESLTIIPPDAPKADQATCSGIELPLSTEKESLGLTTRVQTDIGDLFAVWDTGAGGNIMVKHTTDAAGLDLQARDKFETQRFVIDGHEFGPVRMSVWDVPLPPDLNALLGYWFFSDKVVCVDFPRQSIFVRSNSES